MTELPSLTRILWVPFHAEIASGHPVFFCFSRDWLVELFEANQLNVSDPLSYINAQAANLLNVYGDEAHLRPNAFEIDDSGFSAAIVLVCQQVLAVEEMVRDPGGFTENAYFPRLRRMISPALGVLSHNPFAFDEFETIWRTLASEIRRQTGHSSSTITFRFGVEHGVNKARSFPLSQALLSQQDALTLVSRLGAAKIKSAQPAVLFREMQRVKRDLTRRGQKTLAIPLLRGRILEQISAFATRVKESDLVARTGRVLATTVWEIRAYKDTVDWMTDELRFLLFDTRTGRSISDEDQVCLELRRALSRGGYVVLAPNDIGDGWACGGRESRVGAGDQFFVVGARQALDTCLKRIDELGNSVQLSRVSEGSIRALPGTAFYELLWPVDKTSELVVRYGTIVPAPADANRREYEWIGGLCLSRQSDCFLREALPVGIQFDRAHFSLQDLMKVDDRFVRHEGFKEYAELLTSDTTYMITFPKGFCARLRIGVSRFVTTGRVGFAVDGNGKLSPSVDHLGDTSSGVVGFLPLRLNASPFTSRECAWLLRDLANALGDDLGPRELDAVRSRLGRAAIPEETRLAIEKLLDQKCRVTSTVRRLIRLGS